MRVPATYKSKRFKIFANSSQVFIYVYINIYFNIYIYTLFEFDHILKFET